MIGVWVQEADRPAIEEFFELFKTPWEYGQAGGTYDVIFCGSGCAAPTHAAPLTLLFGPDARPADPASSTIRSDRSGTEASDTKKEGFQTTPKASPVPSPVFTLVTRHGPLPIYTDCRVFVGIAGLQGGSGLTINANGESAICASSSPGGGTTVRIGYDLCAEIRHLLGVGQPPSLAPIPTLDRQIEFIRRMILDAGVPLVEIPPIPDGFDGIVCLSHDVDHVGIRHHKADHTMFGFLFRATLGSLMYWTRGRMTARQVVDNWLAAAKLPAVHLGWARDFWFQFDDYLALENGRPSTFFVIPWSGVAGRRAPGGQLAAPRARAAKYDAAELNPYFNRLRDGRCEIALHGLDAWDDPDKGRAEAAVIWESEASLERGVRMHWLYFDGDSPARLEAAGFTYDSTSGYNEAIGFRAGTAQVFRPLGRSQLLELPLHVMDTALFYPSRMNLAPDAAWSTTTALADEIHRLGGVLTINWHDRSLAPERLWNDFYRRLLDHLDSQRPWFATAADTVAWFRNRRAVRFQKGKGDANFPGITSTTPPQPLNLPGMRLRLHRPDGLVIDKPMIHPQGN